MEQTAKGNVTVGQDIGLLNMRVKPSVTIECKKCKASNSVVVDV
ncbi:hypothetical protein [Rhizobium sp. 18055]|nr:hypothetical protein [Rhizobium sp. 18055]